MDRVAENIIWEILGRLEKTSDRNSASLSCKRLYDVEKAQRHTLRVGCGMEPPDFALKSLCTRFPNLSRVEITYSGWISKLGKQLDDDGLLILSTHCPSLTHLSFSYCTFITDVGLRYLASCSNLTSLLFNFTPRITGCGILSLAVGCNNLSALHLIRCLNVSSVEWLEYLGRLGTLHHLSIINCRSIGEPDLMRLGPGWETLKTLHFEVDANYRYMKVDTWQTQHVPIPCQSMVELSLVNCIMSPGRGLACVLPSCNNLKKIQLDMCVGLRDLDIISLSQTSTQLESLSITLPSHSSLPSFANNPIRLTDPSLIALAHNCSNLQSIRISFSDGEFPPSTSFSLRGILSLLHKCPVRHLALDHVYSFNDIGMETLCFSQYLQNLELVRCQEITDEGLQLVSQYPRLCRLRLSKCLGISDDGLKPLVGSFKLDFLDVEDCPQISERGVQGAAKSVSYRLDLSWMC